MGTKVYLCWKSTETPRGQLEDREELLAVKSTRQAALAWVYTKEAENDWDTRNPYYDFSFEEIEVDGPDLPGLPLL